MSLKTLNTFLLYLRFVLVALPFPGYIYPDQYFQSPEVMAGDILNVKSVRTWEWSPDFPLRSLLFPYISSGIPFYMLKYIFSGLLSPCILLIAPRLSMLVQTMLIEKLLRIIYAHENITDSDFATFLFRSSHVTLIFFTTTFSNTIETFLYLLLLHLVSELLKSRQNIYQTSIFVGIIVSVGIFCRVTFVAFAFYPLVHLALSIMLTEKIGETIKIGTKLFMFVFIGVIMGSAFNMLLDKRYYTKWVLPSYNSYIYNSNNTQLEKHGIHPRSLHFTANSLLLFGPLYVYFIFRLVKGEWVRNNFQILTTLSTMFSIGILSIVPHQEARFISPVLVSLLLSLVQRKRPGKYFFAIWIAFNAALLIWFGFVHQAGVFPSLRFIHDQLKGINGTNVEVLYWKTYMVPRHLLAIPYNNANINLHDLAGADLPVVIEKLKALSANENKVWFVQPSTLHLHMIEEATGLHFQLARQFFPHVSVEALPRQFNLTINALKNAFSLNLYQIARISI